jgi:lipoprotein-releasing system ATP-binding protein
VFQFHHLLPEFTALENTGTPLRIAGTPAVERDRRAGTSSNVGSAVRASAWHAVGENSSASRSPGADHESHRPAADEPTGDPDEHTAESLHTASRDASSAG